MLSYVNPGILMLLLVKYWYFWELMPQLISAVGSSWLRHAAHISHKPTFLQTLSGIIGASACTSESRVGKGRDVPSVIRADTSSWKVGLFDAAPHGTVATSHRELVSQRGKPEEAVWENVHVTSERERQQARVSQPVWLWTTAQNPTQRPANIAHVSQLPKDLWSNLIPEVGFVSLCHQMCMWEWHENSRIKCWLSWELTECQ